MNPFIAICLGLVALVFVGVVYLVIRGIRRRPT